VFIDIAKAAIGISIVIAIATLLASIWVIVSASVLIAIVLRFIFGKKPQRVEAHNDDIMIGPGDF